ncbi:TIGR02678 family protein [Bacillus aquiflavi]|uniref:TIGR02678 family protein n=1 Tax=Bacillus aquiflavi TaxID=2672567 RepID=A0A6B3VUW2_9BACI|nr:TIGR02678 family protein [Bacillus aquiflavi]MBA4536680.1 TIGR02678 family protein [Bacillus aquiflavi]NEY81048.1 TIGR02678 family protein [Bacillus aquiflavi]UAC48715.1 TIGR02678 family protein [Bacillus aquiflavi]
MDNALFDEKAQEALATLMEKFWVLRSLEPDVYQQIRQREHVLKRYVTDKFGFDLIVHQHFIKLEKIPVEPKAWMGIQSFSEPMDYAIFCCGLAFTERRSVDEQFLLSELTEDIQDMYPGEFSLNWTNYQHRKSLVRALKKMVELHIIKMVDGDIEQFAMNEEQEVLYEVTVYARYFMRSYPDDLFQYKTTREILASEWKRHEGEERRKRVYRKLMFSPVVHRESGDDADFAYIRNYRNRLRDDIEEHTPFRLEVFKNAAMLMLDERKQKYTLFPDQKGIMDVVLHFSTVLRENLKIEEINDLGELRLTTSECERILEKVQKRYQHGWSKQYREMTVSQLRKEAVNFLKEWELLQVEVETGMLILKSAIGRMIGEYPRNYVDREGESR